MFATGSKESLRLFDTHRGVQVSTHRRAVSHAADLRALLNVLQLHNFHIERPDWVGGDLYVRAVTVSSVESFLHFSPCPSQLAFSPDGNFVRLRCNFASFQLTLVATGGERQRDANSAGL